MKKKVSRNIIASLLFQITTLLYGLVVPRIILGAFGSEVNGLVSSLNQYLNYITLLEGGVSGVIMASLYKPLSDNDIKKVSGIVKATNGFFRKIAAIFLIYTLVVAAIYPILVHTSFSWSYVFSLAIIVGITLFIQYFFSLTFRLLLNADQKGYVVFYSQIVFTVVNFIATIIVVRVFPEIHILKFVTACAFIIQPVVYRICVKRNYVLDKETPPDRDALKQRWNGFGQNLAFFIHTNTDIVVLTIFSSLLNVSVYCVYYMIASALKSLVVSVSAAIVPSFGKILVSDNDEEKNTAFDLYEFGITTITTVAFTCGIILIVPFVSIYTHGITDANYYQPVFGVLLMFAEEIYCLRDPYVSAAYSSGKFKETAKYAYVEATINIVVSVILVIRFGLIGVAVGTTISMLYRLIVHVVYLNKNILFRPIKKWVKSIGASFINTVFCYLIYWMLPIKEPSSYLEWILIAAAIFGFVLFFMLFEILLLYKKEVCSVLNKMKRREGKNVY